MALVKKGISAVLLLAALVATLLSASFLYSYYMNNPRASCHQHARYHTYVVLLQKPPNAKSMDDDAHRRWHESFLPSTLTDSGEPRLLSSYSHGLNGFVARLTRAEIKAVAKKPGFLRTLRNPRLNLRVVRSRNCEQ